MTLNLLVMIAALLVLTSCVDFKESKSELSFRDESAPISFRDDMDRGDEFLDSSNYFPSAKRVLVKHCLSCHGLGSPRYSWELDENSDEKEWISKLESQLLLHKGDVKKSKLTNRMLFSSQSVRANMPLGGSDFNATDYKAVAQWVVSLSDKMPQQEVDCNLDLVPSKGLRRLSKKEYFETINYWSRELLGPRSQDISKDAAFISAFNKIPDDVKGLYSEDDLNITSYHVESWYYASKALARYFNDTLKNRGTRYEKRFQILCKSLGLGRGTINWSVELTKANRNHLINCMGNLAYKRPLSAQEKSDYIKLIDSISGTKEKIDGFLSVLFNSPQFLFHMEDQGKIIKDSNGEDLIKLTSYEIINKLSYTFWGHAPSLELSHLARDRDLHNDQNYKKALDIIFSSKNIHKVKAKYQRFIDEYLNIGSSLPNFIDSRAFSDFKGNISVNSRLRESMSNEIRSLFDHYTWKTKGSFSDTLVSKRYFADSRELAAIYGDSSYIYNGSSDLYSKESQRSGLLTRAGMLITGSYATSPIHSGVFVLKKILCRDLPEPPPLDPAQLSAALRAPFTTRQEVHAITIDGDRSCASCHNEINPYGNIFEQYDSLGRVRTKEKIYNARGVKIGELPVEYDGTIFIDNSNKYIKNTLELSKQLAASASTNQCYSQNLYKFFMREKSLSKSRLKCEVDKVNSGHNRGGMQQGLRELSNLKSFRYRSLEY